MERILLWCLLALLSSVRCDTQEELPETLWDCLYKKKAYSTFISLAQGVLKQRPAGDVTVFAPTNEAFLATFTPNHRRLLFENLEFAGRTVVEALIVGGYKRERKLIWGDHNTLVEYDIEQGEEPYRIRTFLRDGRVCVRTPIYNLRNNDGIASVVEPDALVKDDGVMHGINKVLLNGNPFLCTENSDCPENLSCLPDPTSNSRCDCDEDVCPCYKTCQPVAPECTNLEPPIIFLDQYHDEIAYDCTGTGVKRWYSFCDARGFIGKPPVDVCAIPAETNLPCSESTNCGGELVCVKNLCSPREPSWLVWSSPLPNWSSPPTGGWPRQLGLDRWHQSVVGDSVAALDAFAPKQIDCNKDVCFGLLDDEEGTVIGWGGLSNKGSPGLTLDGRVRVITTLNREALNGQRLVDFSLGNAEEDAFVAWTRSGRAISWVQEGANNDLANLISNSQGNIRFVSVEDTTSAYAALDSSPFLASASGARGPDRSQLPQGKTLFKTGSGGQVSWAIYTDGTAVMWGTTTDFGAPYSHILPGVEVIDIAHCGATPPAMFIVGRDGSLWSVGQRGVNEELLPALGGGDSAAPGQILGPWTGGVVDVECAADTNIDSAKTYHILLTDMGEVYEWGPDKDDNPLRERAAGGAVQIFAGTHAVGHAW
eukprot:TRINITY_DN67687_c8_g1_i1.p1 TRINITY_DN67687_c8_g1~~TRINITY_DN67687_c8_g1_i1.p1  ORF type:complete len:652 (-),score=46.14 TRINITY_DN67687_c8_g1_i1:1676-3631(-)